MFHQKYLLQGWNSTKASFIVNICMLLTNGHHSILWNVWLIKCSLISSYWGAYLSEIWGHCTQKGHRSRDDTLFCIGSYPGQCWYPIHPFHRMFKVRFKEFSWIKCYLWIQGMMESPTQNVYKEVPCFSRIRVPWIRCLLKTRLQPHLLIHNLLVRVEVRNKLPGNTSTVAPCMFHKILETEEIKEKKSIFIFLLIGKLFLEVIT